MKNALILMSLVTSTMSQADDRSIRINAALLTVHTLHHQPVNPKFPRKLDKRGRGVITPALGIEYIERNKNTYLTVGGFVGQNCIAENIGGMILGYGLNYKYLDLGLVAGGYVQNNKKFEAAASSKNKIIRAPSAPISDTYGIVPIVGFDVTIKIPLTDSISIQQRNLLTPILNNHGVAAEFKF